MESFGTVQDAQVKKLKRILEGWREIVLPVHSVLTWDKKWYPAAIVGAVSLVYLVLWYLEPPFLAFVAAVGSLVVLLDFAVPMLLTRVSAASSWTKNKEKLFEEICKSIVIHTSWVHFTTRSFYAMRETSPRIYYSILVSSLLWTTYVGATTSNVLLFYYSTLVLFLLPGLLSNERFSAYFAQFLQFINGFLKLKTKPE